MANKVKFGLEQVHIAFKNADGYETPGRFREQST